jgi:hypothetical protein
MGSGQLLSHTALSLHEIQIKKKKKKKKKKIKSNLFLLESAEIKPT